MSECVSANNRISQIVGQVILRQRTIHRESTLGECALNKNGINISDCIDGVCEVRAAVAMD